MSGEGQDSVQVQAANAFQLATPVLRDANSQSAAEIINNLPATNRARFIAGQMARETHNHTAACLRIGAWVEEARKASIEYSDLVLEFGHLDMEAPSASRISVYLGAYRAWSGTGVSWDELANYSIDTLYHAGKLIHRQHPQLGALKPEEALSFAAGLSQAELRRASKAGGLESWGSGDASGGEEAESEVVSWKLPRPSLQMFDNLRLRLAGVLGEEVSRAKTLEFMVMLVSGVSDDHLEFAWRAEHGEVEAGEVPEDEFVLVEEDEA